VRESIVRTETVEIPVFQYVQVDPALTEPLTPQEVPTPTNDDLLAAYLEAMALVEQANNDRLTVRSLSDQSSGEVE